MAMIPLQRGIIYGPVASRRLGRSLGINLLPANCKLCSFDCVYCHYGRTQAKSLHPEEDAFPSVQEVLNAVEAALQGGLDFDYLTFSGNGEPTLHPNFAEIVFEVRILRDRLRPQVKLAVLSNSSTANLHHRAGSPGSRRCAHHEAGRRRSAHAKRGQPPGRRDQPGTDPGRLERPARTGHPKCIHRWQSEQRVGRALRSLALGPGRSRPAAGPDLQR